jgi:hypothetical protein
LRVPAVGVDLSFCGHVYLTPPCYGEGLGEAGRVFGQVVETRGEGDFLDW